MIALSSRFMTIACFLSFMLFSGCAGNVLVLETKSPTTPPGIDLSGRWTLQAESRRPGQDNVTSGEELILMTRTQRRRHTTRDGGRSGASAHVFLEFGEALKVTQTPYSMFISYDRSVVEEYTFGENRAVSIGPIEARRVSGWEDNAFVVETLDDSKTTLFETWHLESNGAVLVRDIRISKNEEDSFVRRELYDRQ